MRRSLCSLLMSDHPSSSWRDSSDELRRPTLGPTRHCGMFRMAVVVTRAAFAVVGLGFSFAAPGIATAAPPGLPDLNAFQPVDPATYTARWRGGGAGITFHTPDGLGCGWALSPDTRPEDHISAGCSGPIPGLPDTAPRGQDGCATVGTANAFPSGAASPSDLSPYRFYQGTCIPAQYQTSPVLNVGQKFTANNTTCLVGADRLTACIDPILNRGFVLQPSGSWVF